MDKLPLETQTLYAELMERLMAMETHRSIGHLSGCFTTKMVKGETYCYFQYSDPGGRTRQIYVGKKSPALEKVINEFKKEKVDLRGDQERIQRLCSQIRIGGAIVTDSVSGRVLKALSDGSVFHLGGVLVGTHAFAVLGNLLGVRWEGSAIKTQDIDTASEPVLRIAIPDVRANIPKTLERLEMGFLPIPSLNLKHPSTSFSIRGSALRVDILTPEHKPQRGPIMIQHMNVPAQPLRFLDYLIQDPIKGAVINGGGILVNVPSPARFAFHKLIIAKERPVVMQTKADKDLSQAGQIFEFLAEERPGDLRLAWDAVKKCGPGWVKRVREGVGFLAKKNPKASLALAHFIK